MIPSTPWIITTMENWLPADTKNTKQKTWIKMFSHQNLLLFAFITGEIADAKPTVNMKYDSAFCSN